MWWGCSCCRPTLPSWKSRLRKRGGDSEEAVALRMAKAREEMSHAPEFDHVLVNHDLEHSVEAARAVLQAARLGTSRQTGLAGFLAGMTP